MKTLSSLVILTAMGWSCQGQEQEFDLELCKNRGSHWRNNQHDYLYSGILDEFRGNEKAEKLSWSLAREFCRTRCMDLVSMESEWEARLVARKMKKYGADSIWTSGHICDDSVSEKCTHYEDKGWFWVGSTSLRSLPSTNSTAPKWKKNPWGTTGAFTLSNQKTDPYAAKVPQPDNAEQVLNLERGEEEACLAVYRDLWEKGTYWNDVSCYSPLEWVCEDSTELLTKAGLNQPIIFGK